MRDWLAEPPLWSAEDLPLFEGQVLDLAFRTTKGASLYARGWLERLSDGWALRLLDVSDQIERVRAGEQRLQLLAHATRLGSRLWQARTEDVERLLEEFLEGLVLRLGIAAAGLFLAQGGGSWARCSRFVRPGTRAALPDEAELQPLLDSHCAAPKRVGQGNDSLWLVPYGERGGVQAWLVCLDAESAIPVLSGEDWLYLLAGVAMPWLQLLRLEAHRAEEERSQCLQELLDSSWWEYLPAEDRYLFGPGFADRLFGTAAEPMDMPGLMHPADRDEFRVHLADTVAHGGMFDQVLRLRSGDGWRWFRLGGRMQRGRIIGFAVDIDDFKTNEALAAAAISRLENLVDRAPAIIYVERYKDGALTPEFVSASLETVLGWTLPELRERSVFSLVHEEDREIFLERTRCLLRDGKVGCNYRLRDRLGGYHWIHDEAKLLRDDEGQPLEAVGLCLDVTETREATERVRQSEERYRLLVEDSPSMICRYRPDLTLTFANRPLLRYLGCGDEAIGTLNLSKFLTEEQCEDFRKRLSAMTPAQPLSTVEIRVQLPGHEHAWWLWSERGVFDENGFLIEVQAVGRDDTELHRSRQQLYQSAKMATLGTMATGIAHEISQPLNVMRVALMNLLKRVENGELTDDYLLTKLGRIEGQVQRAARIVDHMRVFGRRSEIERQYFQPKEAVEGAVGLLCDRLQQKGIALDMELGELPELLGHADQLEQVLINLLVNASDALLSRQEREPELRPWIQVRAGLRDGRVLIEVEDNAGGIEPELLERIFDPFFTTKPVGKGTGLGLSVSYGIIRQMGGQLKVRNATRGACFSVDLPVG
ncbi:PAS domain-containing sensor histidine kinase [Zestomonas thermotolerans]|uniref:PAS domain-containing sensor histidine kinase n=1 Tax=Zestomonas thermotolerans TaxID=157784 RepID=UPI000480BFAD